MPFLFVEEGRVTRLHTERRQEGVLVGEGKPAKSGEVEDELLGRDARLSAAGRTAATASSNATAEELSDSASIAERLALD